jgi:hypothetical protein
MEQSEKQIYDILVRAEWLENIAESESPLQKGVSERVLSFRTGATQLENGKFKLWIFSKLYRELLKSGGISTGDLNQLIQMGAALGIQAGWEKLPEK